MITFAPLPHDSDDTIGSSLVGYLPQGTTYALLAKLFGEPNKDVDGYKVSTCWAIRFADGLIATIYDYKATSLYDDEYPLPEDVWSDRAEVEWHIGGHNSAVAERVRELVVNKKTV